ncbi:ROK family protein [Streptomyces sp. NBC_00683]|uniref:ROK family protein n=1 Tax=Streptomyces sp. NBC_00683 TaxID=2903670 RepID=UPI002E323383|nr:ROK family protein [Streptomyces sp. NBC_00683]
MTAESITVGGPQVHVVADLGGTTLRIGRVTGGSSRVEDVRRIATEGLGRYGTLSAQALQDRVMEQLGAELAAYLESPSGAGASAVGVSFAGPMSRDGVVLAGPTLWGGDAEPLPVARLLTQRLGLPVLAANDITAAAWRYAAVEAAPFCLITVSSGIGSKVFRHGEVLIDEAGHGGEIGHWRVDPSDSAPPCECGGRGHLGAIASGRGVLLGARRAAAEDPGGFARSVLAGPAGNRPEGVTNEALAAAIREGDPFATAVLRTALVPLASAVNCIFTAIGIRRYLFIGGFAIAVGQRFLTLLGDELTRLGCFGLSDSETRDMLALGAADDDHCLIGIGQMLARTLPASEVTGAHTHRR